MQACRPGGRGRDVATPTQVQQRAKDVPSCTVGAREVDVQEPLVRRNGRVTFRHADNRIRVEARHQRMLVRTMVGG